MLDQIKQQISRVGRWERVTWTHAGTRWKKPIHSHVERQFERIERYI